MAFIPAVNTVKTAIEGSLGGQVIINTLYWLFTGAPSETNVADLADRVLEWCVDEMLSVLSQDFQLVGVTATDQTTDHGYQANASPLTTEVGVSTSPASPANVAGVVTFRTSQVGRSYRGRNYIAGIPDDVTDSPVIFDPTWVSNVVASYALLSGVETDIDCTHVVCSRYTANAPRVTAVLTPITSYTMDSNIDSQRRRLAGRGA